MTDLFTENKDDFTSYIPGETGKYKTTEDLAKGKYESDLHIKTIERENAELRASNLQLREDNVAKAKLEELIDKLSSVDRQSQESSQGNNPKSLDAKPFDPTALESLVQETLKKHEVTRTREQNTKVVVDALKERYGHNYLDVLNKQTEELGLSKEAVNYLAETAPKAFFKTLGLDSEVKTESFQAPPRRSPFFAPKGEPKRSWSYYQQLRKEKPSEYNSPHVQAQMHNDYMKLGKDFEDGDFMVMGQESAF